jgi:hypothetical protein
VADIKMRRKSGREGSNLRSNINKNSEYLFFLKNK